jgi:hypothetical protein
MYIFLAAIFPYSYWVLKLQSYKLTSSLIAMGFESTINHLLCYRLPLQPLGFAATIFRVITFPDSHLGLELLPSWLSSSLTDTGFRSFHLLDFHLPLQPLGFVNCLLGYDLPVNYLTVN